MSLRARDIPVSDIAVIVNAFSKATTRSGRYHEKIWKCSFSLQLALFSSLVFYFCFSFDFSPSIIIPHWFSSTCFSCLSLALLVFWQSFSTVSRLNVNELFLHMARIVRQKSATVRKTSFISSKHPRRAMLKQTIINRKLLSILKQCMTSYNRFTISIQSSNSFWINCDSCLHNLDPIIKLVQNELWFLSLQEFRARDVAEIVNALSRANTWDSGLFRWTMLGRGEERRGERMGGEGSGRYHANISKFSFSLQLALF